MQDAALLERAAALDPLEEARAVYEIAGLACDGRTTVAELCDRFSDADSRDALLAMVWSLSPLDVGLLAPAWAGLRDADA